MKYRVRISALCYGDVEVAANSEEEAIAIAEKSDINFFDREITDMTAEKIAGAPLCGYNSETIAEPLILEPEDWTAEEWETLCKLAGRLPVSQTQRIVFHADRMEYYVAPEESAAAIFEPTTQKNNNNDRTYTVTEFCPHCETEIEMRWNTDVLGFKAFCPVCGKRLMLCDECRHAGECTSCDYDSRLDCCRHSQPVPKADDSGIVRVISAMRMGKFRQIPN